MTDASDLVSQILEDVTDLPSIPAVALEIIRLTGDETCTLDQFAAVLSRDPALASKVLRFANSSLYNLGSPVSTLQRATMVLGTRAVKVMSLSFSLAGTLPSENDGPFDIGEYWRRSVICAVAARSLAERLESPLIEEAFLCGLLSRIGQLVVGTGQPELYAELSSEGWPRPERERRVLGCDGYEIGAALLRTWSLPEFLCDALSCTAEPSRLPASASPQATELAGIVGAAALCEELICGQGQTVSAMELVSQIQALHPMQLEELEEFLTALEPAVAETAKMLEIEMDPLRIAEIPAIAQRLLLQESLGIASEAMEARQHAARLEMRNRVLNDQAHTDGLTGLLNRAAFDESLARCFAERRTHAGDRSVGLLLVDVDHFKQVNDRYGHPVGDDVLRNIGRAIRGVMRDDDMAARYGGEELAAIFPSVCAEGLAAVAERIRTAVESATCEHEGETVRVTVSVGGARADEIEGDDPIRSLVELADRRLYAAKRQGRNQSRTTDRE